MSDEEQTAERAIYRVLIEAPIETVWNTLVKTDEVLPFFFGAVCDTEDGLKPGAPMRMITKSRSYATVVGEVLEFSPPLRYVHTLKFTQWDDAPCTVIYDLKETSAGVEFTLTTEGVPAGSKTEKSMASGGNYIVKTLKHVAENGKPSFATKLMLGVFNLLAPLAPNASRIEHWPLRNTPPGPTDMKEDE